MGGDSRIPRLSLRPLLHGFNTILSVTLRKLTSNEGIRRKEFNHTPLNPYITRVLACRKTRQSVDFKTSVPSTPIVV